MNKLTKIFKSDEPTQGEVNNQKELFLLSKKSQRRVSRVLWKGGDSTGKGAERLVINEYETRHLRDYGNGKKFKRRLTQKQWAKLQRKNVQ